MSVLSIAAAHYRRQVALARRAARDIGRLWSRVDRQAIGPSWRASLPAAVQVLATAQALAAASSSVYLDDVLEAQGVDPEADGRVQVAAFAGMAADGRSLADLLYQPAITALTALDRGQTVPRALTGGRLALDMIVRTEVADAGRTADQVALVARRNVPGYVRLLSPPSCSRCVILAGRWYRWNAGFARHPRCDCRAIPAPEDAAGDLRTDPRSYFDSLSEQERKRAGWSKADQQAIADGADLNQVTNARRGIYTAGGKQLTTAGGRRRPRIAPEQIYREANGNRTEAIRLLRLHGYLR